MARLTGQVRETGLLDGLEVMVVTVTVEIAGVIGRDYKQRSR
jgi:hypothetical protein